MIKVVVVTLLFGALLGLEWYDARITNELCYLQLKNKRTLDEEARFKVVFKRSKYTTIGEYVVLVALVIAMFMDLVHAW